MKEVFQTIKDLCFEAKRILEKDRDNSLFHERLFGASVKKDNNALIWKGKMPIGLTVVTAGWDPRATFDEIHAFGSKFSAGVDAITIEESPAGGKVQNTRGRSQTARLRAQPYKRD